MRRPGSPLVHEGGVATRTLRLAALLLLPAAARAEPLPRSNPEAQGVSSAALRAFVEAADRQVEFMNSVMLLRHGHVVCEAWWSPYRADAPHALYSLSKSFTATAVGLAAAEGKLSVDDPVLKFFPDDAPAEPSSNLKAMRVSDLLRMSTGQQTEPKRPADAVWTRVFLAHPVPFRPGTHFLYNTSGTYMLSAIVQQATGQTVLDYLRPRLFDPLGIERPAWETSPQGVTTGGYGLSIRTEDIARFGQLYLQKGKWHGTQLVPAAWVERATGLQTSNGSDPTSDWQQGYGYQFWRCRHGAYRGDGAFGQYCVVLPKQDAVLVITSGVQDMQATLDLVWDKLLPAFKDASLPPDDAAHTQLKAVLAGLTIRPQEGRGTPATLPGKTYRFESNDLKLETARLERDGDDAALVLRADGATERIVCGTRAWTRGRAALGVLRDQPVAATGAWPGDDTFRAKLCFYETPFIVTLELRFAGDTLRLSARANVGPAAAERPALVGKAE
jgi:CubicO group peptidase (beta-lactamase class C family)